MTMGRTIGIRAALATASRATSNALNGFTTLGDMPSLPASDSALHAALLADVESVIAEGAKRRWFSKKIETIYAEATRQARYRSFIVMAVTGLIFYNLFLFADALIIPDQLWLFSVIQLGIVTPLAVAMLTRVTRHKLDCDVASIVILAVMMVGILVGLRMTEGRYAILIACALNLMIISSNLFVAIPFSWATLYTFLANIVIAVALFSHPAIETSAASFILTMTLAASVYSVVGHHRIDAGVRGAFLFTLRERLRSDQLTASNRRLNALADIDGLTGIGNRRAFDRVMNDLCGRSDVGLVLIDIDHFKLLNDRHGHLAGDACLRQVASLLVDRMPAPRHFVARYGGEEFAVIITSGDAKTVLAVAEDIRSAIGAAILVEEEGGDAIRATVSVGCACLPDGPTASPVSLIAAADGALYEAKRSGRNRTRLGRVPAPDPNTVPRSDTMVRDAA